MAVHEHRGYSWGTYLQDGGDLCMMDPKLQSVLGQVYSGPGELLSFNIGLQYVAPKTVCNFVRGFRVQVTIK